MLYLGVEIKIRALDVLLAPAEAAVCRISLEASIKNERAGRRGGRKSSVSGQRLLPNRSRFIETVLIKHQVDEGIDDFPVDARLQTHQVIPHIQGRTSLLRLNQLGDP